MTFQLYTKVFTSSKLTHVLAELFHACFYLSCAHILGMKSFKNLVFQTPQLCLPVCKQLASYDSCSWRIEVTDRQSSVFYIVEGAPFILIARQFSSYLLSSFNFVHGSFSEEPKTGMFLQFHSDKVKSSNSFSPY